MVGAVACNTFCYFKGGILMHGRFRVLRRMLFAAMALVALAVPATAALAPGLAQAMSTAKTALIDEQSVTTDDGIEKEGTPISLEAVRGGKGRLHRHDPQRR